ncbi:hypothetical protein GCM10018966_027910 [Streptomyces yanii]
MSWSVLLTSVTGQGWESVDVDRQLTVVEGLMRAQSGNRGSVASCRRLTRIQAHPTFVTALTGDTV